MKKKITLVATSVLLVAAMVIGGTLAYFTDTDAKTNTFTIGGVDIQLIEKDKEGKDWTSKQLMPGENNAVIKNVTVKNIADTPAYMWIEMWIPTALDDANAANNSLHMNCFDTYVKPDGTMEPMRGSVAQAAGYTVKYVTAIQELGEVQGYTGYRVWIENDTPKAKDESTASLLYRVFMDQRIEQCNVADHEDGCMVLADGTTHYDGEWEIIVKAFGIQSEGFANIEEAIAAYDGEGAGQP